MTRTSIAPIAAVLLLSAAVTALGQTAETRIGQLVRPGTGDDSQARLALRGMTNASFRPGAVSERASHEAALLNGLSTRTEWEVKSFLLDELALQGNISAVAPIAAYLSHVNLCEPAALALQMVGATEGADKVLPALRAAHAAAAGKCRVALVNALGTLRDADPGTVDRLLGDAAGADPDLRAVALRALANGGDLKARTVLAEALKAADTYLRSRAVSLNLHYALRLAERSRKSEGVEIAVGIKAAAQADGRMHVVISADTALARIGRTIPLAVGPGERGAPGSGGVSAAFLLRGARGGVQVPVLAPGSPVLRLVDMQGRVIREWRGQP